MKNRFFLLVLLVSFLSVTSLSASLILSTDFTGRTVSGNSVTGPPSIWTTDGVNAPGTITAVDVNSTGSLAGLFTTGPASGHFAPNLNIENEGPWSVDIPLAFASNTAALTIEEVVIDWQNFNNFGNFQTGNNHTTEFTVEIVGSTSGSINSTMVTTPGGTTKSGIETAMFTAPSTISETVETWSVRITADGSGAGNNLGLDALSINGAIFVPEPSTGLALYTLLGLAGLRRRRRAFPVA